MSLVTKKILCIPTKETIIIYSILGWLLLLLLLLQLYTTTTAILLYYYYLYYYNYLLLLLYINSVLKRSTLFWMCSRLSTNFNGAYEW